MGGPGSQEGLEHLSRSFLEQEVRGSILAIAQNVSNNFQILYFLLYMKLCLIPKSCAHQRNEGRNLSNSMHRRQDLIHSRVDFKENAIY